MSVHDFRIDYSQTPVILIGFMEISFSNITRSRYLICSFWNLYFSRQRHSLCSTRISSTLQIILACCSMVLVKIRMLSRYTTTIPSAMRSQNILFIIIWKIARLLVILKNITRGSNRSHLVQKMIFHLSPGLIYTLLKP